MSMESHSTRWSTDQWAATKIAAKHKGETVSEYIRTAVLARASYDLGGRKDAVGKKFDRLWPAAGQAGKDLRDVYDLDEP